MTTGIFYSHIFKTSPGPVVGLKFKNFPEVLSDVLKLPNVTLFEHDPVSEDFLVNPSNQFAMGHRVIRPSKPIGIVR